MRDYQYRAVCDCGLGATSAYRRQAQADIDDHKRRNPNHVPRVERMWHGVYSMPTLQELQERRRGSTN